MVVSTACLEGVKFDLSPWPLVDQWYSRFKKENPDIWSYGQTCVDLMLEYFSSQGNK